MLNWHEIAKISNTKKLDGGLLVIMADDLPFLISVGMKANAVPPPLELPRELEVASLAEVREDSAIVHFKGMDTIDKAKEYVGCKLLAWLEPDVYEELSGEATPSIVGYKLYDPKIGLIGTIEDVEGKLDQLLLHVSVESDSISKENVLVPMADDLLVSQDDDAREIVVDCPTGLFEL